MIRVPLNMTMSPWIVKHAPGDIRFIPGRNTPAPHGETRQRQARLRNCYRSGTGHSDTRVLADALALPEVQRARVAAALVASLDGDVDRDAGMHWGAEIERRLNRIEAGQAKWISMAESVERLHRIARGGGHVPGSSTKRC